MLVALALAAPLPGQERVATIVFDKQSKDFGKVMEGEKLKHVFLFKNKGTATLEILRVEPSCGCTAAVLSSPRTPPGGEGRIEVAVDTQGMRGRVSRDISVTTNDPRQPQLALTVSAEVEPEFILSTRAINFGTNPPGKAVTQELTITIQGDPPQKILGVSSSDEAVTAELQEVSGSGGRIYRVIAEQKADAQEKYHFGMLVLKTSSALTPELKVSVRGLVAPAPRD